MARLARALSPAEPSDAWRVLRLAAAVIGPLSLRALVLGWTMTLGAAPVLVIGAIAMSMPTDAHGR